MLSEKLVYNMNSNLKHAIRAKNNITTHCGLLIQ